MVIKRYWEMPNRETFKIPAIKEILERYNVNSGWFDPFSGNNSPAGLTNDLNPTCNAKYHLHALEFINMLEDNTYDGCLFDPPYSTRQMKECYNSIGIEKISFDDSNKFPGNCRNVIAPKIKDGGYCVSFGWNTNGIGEKNGFKKIEIILIAHGGHHNDTLITIEKKQASQIGLMV